MDPVERRAPSGPVVLIHTESPPGIGLAACCALPMPVDNAPGRYPRLACPGCAAKLYSDGRTYADGLRDGWKLLRAVLNGAAMAWRTAEGRKAFGELLGGLPEGPQT